MFVLGEKSNYDAVLVDLLATASRTEAYANAARLGGELSGGIAIVPFFGEPCRCGPDGIDSPSGRLDTIGSILVTRYLLHAGAASLSGEWLPYRDLRDGRQFSSYIRANVEDPVAAAFGGKRPLLEARLLGLGGRPLEDRMSADIAMVIPALPRVPLLGLFRDADEEFPASFQFFFDACALSYLDLESLAVLLDYTAMKLKE